MDDGSLKGLDAETGEGATPIAGPPEIRAIAPMPSEAPDILPGTNSIGRGYDVFGEYCDASSLKARLIDLGPAEEYVSDNVAKMRTSPLVEVAVARSGMASSVTGFSLREYSEQFSAAISLKGSYGFFSGELDAAYKTSDSGKATTTFAQYNSELYSFSLSLQSPAALQDRLTEAARNDFRDHSAHELIETYGTHYLSSFLIGGRCSYCCTIDTSQYSSSVEISVAVKVAMETALRSGEGSATVDQKKAAEQINNVATVRVRMVGGDRGLIERIRDGEFDAWSKSVADNLEVADLAGGLVRISRLVADADRAAEIDAAIDAELARHPMPDAPDVTPIHGYHAPKTPSRWYFATDTRTAPSGWRKLTTPFSVLTDPRPGTVPIYRFSAAGPDRFRFSPKSDPGGGWGQRELAFHAWTAPPADTPTLRIYAYVAQADEAHSGWYYSPQASVSGWTRKPDEEFYVPAV